MSTNQQRQDEFWMRRCLELAGSYSGHTWPNPAVGCVIIDKHGKVLAEGFHKRAGTLHAEAHALAQLGGRARGATLYVNLEPCAHKKNRRTQPCAPMVLSAGLRRVVIGMRDPIRSHSGGAALLARHGVAITLGVLEEECRELNRGFISQAQKQRPWFALKTAATLDGFVSTNFGESENITSPETQAWARYHLRSRFDAILVGIGTVLADNPSLTSRVDKKTIANYQETDSQIVGFAGKPILRDPVRIVVDSRLRTPPSARALSSAGTIIVTTNDAKKTREAALTRAGAQIVRVPARRGQVDLNALAKALGTLGLSSVLVEGGPTIHRGFLDTCADEIYYFVASTLFLGEGKPWVAGPGVKSRQAKRLTALPSTRHFDDGWLLRYRV